MVQYRKERVALVAGLRFKEFQVPDGRLVEQHRLLKDMRLDRGEVGKAALLSFFQISKQTTSGGGSECKRLDPETCEVVRLKMRLQALPGGVLIKEVGINELEAL